MKQSFIQLQSLSIFSTNETNFKKIIYAKTCYKSLQNKNNFYYVDYLDY